MFLNKYIYSDLENTDNFKNMDNSQNIIMGIFNMIDNTNNEEDNNQKLYGNNTSMISSTQSVQNNSFFRRTNSMEVLIPESNEYDFDMDMSDSDENYEKVYELNDSEYVIDIINKAKMDTTLRSNDSTMFSKCNCFCCINYLTIHNNNFMKYIKKYEIENKSKIPRSSTNIKKLFKLKPELFQFIDLSKIRYLKDFDKNNIVNSNTYQHKYEIWMHEKQDNETILKCSICCKEFCSTHIDYNPFFHKKCECCDKGNWNICSWCVHDHLKFFVQDDKLLYEKDFCSILHNK